MNKSSCPGWVVQMVKVSSWCAKVVGSIPRAHTGDDQWMHGWLEQWVVVSLSLSLLRFLSLSKFNKIKKNFFLKKEFLCFLFPPAFGVASVLNFNHSNICAVVSHCYFNLWFPNDKWYWESFHFFLFSLLLLFNILFCTFNICILYFYISILHCLYYVEDIFICLFAICISSLVRCLFSLLPIF